MNRAGRLLASLSLVPLLLAIACSDAEPGMGTPPGEAAGLSAGGAASFPFARKGLLPARKTAAELRRASAKADWISDWRSAHPEWYAITTPPAVGDVRPMVEWESMQSNMIAYVDYLSQDPDVRRTLVDIAAATMDYADLWVIYQSASMRDDLTVRLQAKGVSSRTIADRVQWFQIPNDSVWLVDFGPLPLVDKTTNAVAFLDWRYYTDTDRVLDDAVPSRLGEAIGATVYRQPFDIEGGNFQADSHGVCYTTQRAFYWTGEQPETLETQLRYYAGCTELVVLRDIHDDGTGHIDMLFKLVSDDVALVGEYADGQDSRAKADMDWNAQLLEARGMTVYRMPMPSKGLFNTGWGIEYIPRTYLNSTFVNGPRGKVNLWPVYGDDQAIQAQAQAVWEAAMPDWDHVGIRADEIALMSGTIHCITRTIPALPVTKWVADGDCLGGACDPPAGGYDGACAADTDCTGPEWLCPRNDCVFSPSDPCATDADCVGDAARCETGACLGGLCRYASTCAAGEQCFLGACVEGCGALGWEGCCDGSTSWYCNDGTLAVVDCPTEEGTSTCAWSDQNGYYCAGTDNGDNPALPRSCAAYLPQDPTCATDEDCAVDTLCEVGVCLDGMCTVNPVACPDGEACDPATGSCVACTADCTDRTCGDDGCGGTCGSCDDGDPCTADACSEGACTHAPITNCCVADGDCDDGDPCTEDGCVENECLHATMTGCCAVDADCDDGSACTTDTCVEGACANAITVECPAGETCNPATGVCQGGCVAQCAGRTCGDDGCGGSCGTCTTGLCFEGQCVTDCAGVPYEGCCAGAVAWYCNTELNVLESFECGTGDATDYPYCAWTGPDYGYFCMQEEGGAEPSGTLPLECSAYVTPCATDAECTDRDACTTDYCIDGSCTHAPAVTCGDGEACNPETGACEADPNAICAVMPYEGCCQGEVVVWCEEGVLQELDCVTDGEQPTTCGWWEENGFFACGATDPVPDGTSELCPGACMSDAECDDGKLCTTDTCAAERCQHARIEGCCEVVADCNDRDPCTTDACSANRCGYTDVPDCECTDALCDDADACTTESCNADGLCDYRPVAGCCNDAAQCDDGNVCTEDACTDHACEHTPIPDCAQPCEATAECLDTDVCTNDRCVEGVCQHSAIVGCCVVDADCGDAQRCTVDTCLNSVCNHVPMQCEGGLVCNPASGDCEPPCVPDCANRVCGDNGCGGTCGSCPAGHECSARGDECVETCSCIGMDCGVPAPGCEPCGECAAGEVCTVMFQCVPDASGSDVGGGESDTGGGATHDASGGGDTGTGGTGGGGGGGCAAAPTSAPIAPAGLLLLLAILGAALLRRRRV